MNYNQLVVLSDAVAGREDEYNDWYENSDSERIGVVRTGAV
jgi:hypothetical protein